ncbi:MAG: adenylate/guanylate cyclase domain-containing protein [Alphaproteobacteria bacterium]|nr:adenylate/guanylate cyclase domain-containing protein [Alphaproteobacteria bacterium]
MPDEIVKPAAFKESAVHEISDWIIESSLNGIGADMLIKGFCERLNAAGLPMDRCSVAMSFLHPMFRAFSVNWSTDRGVQRNRFPHAGAQTDAWKKSPFKAMLDSDDHDIRLRIKDGEGMRFSVIPELKERGFTDYYTTITSFTWPQSKARSFLDGSMSSWATKHPDGFDDSHIEALRRLIPRLGLGLKIYAREATTHNVVSAYLGNHAGSRVLDGQFKLGDGDEINAAIWFSDLRGSTEAADRMPAELFLTRLNRYFQCTAGAVMDHGGEVLRFIGDAVLAIFPISGPGGAERAARMAISAARDAIRRIEEDNKKPPDDDPEPLDFGLGLHMGDVYYGNIGVVDRVEFSVIGHTANEAARLQDLTKELHRTVIVSDSFASVATEDWEAMGSYQLRGVAEPQPIYAMKIEGD